MSQAEAPRADSPTRAPGESRHIAWIGVGDEIFGVARAMTSLATAMQQRGFRVTLVCLTEGALTELARQIGIETVVLGESAPPSFPGGLLAKPAELLRFWRHTSRITPKIRDELVRRRVQVVHVVSPNILSIAAAAARGAGAACYWEMPNEISNRYPFGLNRRLYHRVIRKNRVTVLANSAYTARSIRGTGVEPIVFYAATNEALFDPSKTTPAAREPLNTPESAVLVGVFARLYREKGQIDLIRAVHALGSEGGELHLLIVGGPLEGEFYDGLKTEVESLGLAERVHFVAPTDQVAPLIGACDFTANVRTDAEPFGLSVIESMLMCRPTLVHALGGPAESVIDGETGWHLANMQISTVVAGLRRALKDRDRWPAMGAAGRRRALSKFTASTLADHYQRLLTAGA